MKKIVVVFFFSILFLCIKAQIPNGDIEDWTWVGGWYENPDSWTTNNSQISTSGVQKVTDAYHGLYAMRLINSSNQRAWAQTKFPLVIHPANLIAYVKCKLADTTDTVSIEIVLLNNGVNVDSGSWLGTSAIMNYTQISIPITQNNKSIDSAIIFVSGGSHIASGGILIGTWFLVDSLSFDFTNSIKNYNEGDEIEIYPNPLTSSSTLQFTTQLKDAQVIIYDMLGKEMMRKSFSGDKMEIERGNLVSGVYFVKVSTEERQYIQKIIVQ